MASPTSPIDLSVNSNNQSLGETAHVVEVFSSIQGEGPYIGTKQIFTRFFACNLRCHYCDTPESLTGNPSARLMNLDGNWDIHQNPLTQNELFVAVERLAAESTHEAVSLTGGEPLLWKDFLIRFLPRVRGLGLNTYLETNGTLPVHLKAVLPFINTVSMDIKLPETLKGGRDWFAKHQEFLKIALETEVFCKLVLPAGDKSAEVSRAAAMVAEVSPRIPFIIQPVTPVDGMKDKPTPAEINLAYDTARKLLYDVRVIPQTHKSMGLI